MGNHSADNDDFSGFEDLLNILLLLAVVLAILAILIYGVIILATTL